MFTSERLHSELKHGGVRAPVIVVVVVVECCCFLINIIVEPPGPWPLPFGVDETLTFIKTCHFVSTIRLPARIDPLWL